MRRCPLCGQQPGEGGQVRLTAAFLGELDADFKVTALQVKFAYLVFFQELDQFPQFLHLFRIHLHSACRILPCAEAVRRGHNSISALFTGVSTLWPRSVTATISSMRMPNFPARYTPGSMVTTMPGFNY